MGSRICSIIYFTEYLKHKGHDVDWQVPEYYSRTLAPHIHLMVSSAHYS